MFGIVLVVFYCNLRNNCLIVERKPEMLKLIGFVTVTWFLFWTGIAQFLLGLTAVLGTLIFA